MGDSGVTFRSAEAGDAGAVLEMMRAFYTEEGLAFGEEVEGALRRLLADPSMGSVQVAADTAGLVGYFVISILLLPDLGYGSVRTWISHPVPAIALALLVVNVFWHARLGLREMIGDYVHDDGNKFAAFLLINFAAAGGVAFGLLSILKLAIGGGAA